MDDSSESISDDEEMPPLEDIPLVPMTPPSLVNLVLCMLVSIGKHEPLDDLIGRVFECMYCGRYRTIEHTCPNSHVMRRKCRPIITLIEI